MINYLKTFSLEFLYVFHEAAIYIVFGFFIAGIISVFIPKGFLKKAEPVGTRLNGGGSV